MSESGFWQDEDYLAVGKLVVAYAMAETFLWWLGHDLGVDQELLDLRSASKVSSAVQRRLAPRADLAAEVRSAVAELQKAKQVRDGISHSALVLLRTPTGFDQLQIRARSLQESPFDRAAVQEATRTSSAVTTRLREVMQEVGAGRRRIPEA